MSEIDLIPDDYRQYLMLKYWLKVLVLLVLMVLILVFSVKYIYSYKTKHIQDKIISLQQQKAINTRQSIELASIKEKKSELQLQWDLLSGLRSGAAVESMLKMIDRSLVGNDVWFTNWKFRRAGLLVDIKPEEVNTGYFIVIPKGESVSKGNKRQVQTNMTIKGQARDHAALSDFVQRLLRQPEVYDVKVLRTSLTRYSMISVVDFDVTVIVNTLVELG